MPSALRAHPPRNHTPKPVWLSPNYLWSSLSFWENGPREVVRLRKWPDFKRGCWDRTRWPTFLLQTLGLTTHTCASCAPWISDSTMGHV